MKAIGIDIGTTTVCGIVLDAETGEVLKVCTKSNTSKLEGKSYEKIQDPGVIMQIVSEIYQDFKSSFSDIGCIGVTGQMHGIVYTDANGEAVSPLYTWQDESGNELNADGVRYVDRLRELTGYPMATGFGVTTHYYMVQNGLVPETAVSLATIPDYVAMKLTGNAKPVMAPSLAASIGCFDLEKLEFDAEALKKASIDPDFLPECRNGICLIGRTPDGIPVSAGVGDNQASVLGSVKDVSHSVLINVGTGSQVSAGIDHYIDPEHVELRPLADSDYILAGSSLCGGRAYAAMETFLRQTVTAMTGQECDKLYGRMAELLEAYADQDSDLVANTRYCGTRENPSITGSFTNLTLDNFTPQDMIRSVLYGIAEELDTYHKEMLRQGAAQPQYLVGSGNGIRQNRYLQKIFENIYNLPMQIPVHHEEASYGVALFALTAAGIKGSMAEAQKLIQYV